ncbi:uncharacterized protein MONBRDRAFT_10567 [Monosiga brevicollis MX1]|uniref:Uncharacterized protein n=1 Tax=Monosiga brevicollis TaxID=81824 RepID=A9V6R9_MONBE|nr:uncharacterized protein MONBRDRAFT_10567 [Monosiga brevicollis MX1]EDQ86854.1 predicted protein [Monosiga brevicollis MX1]|eukprot:XP_001748399.1 hypothetical protein [Monosiga brevicollis MX1]
MADWAAESESHFQLAARQQLATQSPKKQSIQASFVSSQSEAARLGAPLLRRPSHENGRPAPAPHASASEPRRRRPPSSPRRSAPTTPTGKGKAQRDANPTGSLRITLSSPSAGSHPSRAVKLVPSPQKPSSSPGKVSNDEKPSPRKTPNRKSKSASKHSAAVAASPDSKAVPAAAAAAAASAEKPTNQAPKSKNQGKKQKKKSRGNGNKGTAHRTVSTPPATTPSNSTSPMVLPAPTGTPKASPAKPADGTRTPSPEPKSALSTTSSRGQMSLKSQRSSQRRSRTATAHREGASDRAPLSTDATDVRKKLWPSTFDAALSDEQMKGSLLEAGAAQDLSLLIASELVSSLINEATASCAQAPSQGAIGIFERPVVPISPQAKDSAASPKPEFSPALVVSVGAGDKFAFTNIAEAKINIAPQAAGKATGPPSDEPAHEPAHEPLVAASKNATASTTSVVEEACNSDDEAAAQMASVLESTESGNEGATMAAAEPATEPTSVGSVSEVASKDIEPASDMTGVADEATPAQAQATDEDKVVKLPIEGSIEVVGPTTEAATESPKPMLETDGESLEMTSEPTEGLVEEASEAAEPDSTTAEPAVESDNHQLSELTADDTHKAVHHQPPSWPATPVARSAEHETSADFSVMSASLVASVSHAISTEEAHASEAEEQLAQALHENAELLEQLNSLHAEAQRQLEIDQLQTEQRLHNDNKDQALARIVRLEQEVSGLRSIQLASEEEVIELRKQLASQTASKDEARGRCQTLEEECGQLQAELAQLEQTRAEQEKSAITRTASLQEQLNQARRELDEALTSLKKKTCAMDAEKQAHAKTVKDWELKQAEVSKELEAAQASAQASAKSLESSANEYKLAIDRLRKERDDALGSKRANEQMSQQLHSQLATVRAELAESQSSVQAKDVELTSAREECSRLAQEIEQLQAELALRSDETQELDGNATVYLDAQSDSLIDSAAPTPARPQTPGSRMASPTRRGLAGLQLLQKIARHAPAGEDVTLTVNEQKCMSRFYHGLSSHGQQLWHLVEYLERIRRGLTSLETSPAPLSPLREASSGDESANLDFGQSIMGLRTVRTEALLWQLLFSYQ